MRILISKKCANTVIFWLLFISSLISCRQKPSFRQQSINKADSIVNIYIGGSIITKDTSSDAFHILKAYVQNDTAYLKEVEKNIKQFDEYLISETRFNACVKQISDIDKSKEGTVYIFKYSRAFTYYDLILRITRLEDSCHMKAVIYRPSNVVLHNGKEIVRNYEKRMYCKVLREWTRTISVTDFESVVSDLEYCNFWSLETLEEDPGYLDGDDLAIFGYSYNTNYLDRVSKRYHVVYRRIPERLSINRAFKTTLKLAGIYDIENLRTVLSPHTYGINTPYDNK